MRGFARAAFGAVALVALLGACTTSGTTTAGTPATAINYAAIINAPDRTDTDRKNDDRREPVKLLAFTGVQPGWRVLDMAAGAGYSTEIMARGAAPGGVVFGQNPPDAPPRVTDAYKARMDHAAMKNVIPDPRPFDAPLPPGAPALDLITFFFGYHDTTYMTVDRAKMNKAMFDALRPGGYLVVADYAAAPGAPVTTGKSFHRLDEAIEKQEIEAAGFKLVDEGNFLRNAQDTHDFPVFNPKIPIDIYVIKFQKR